MTPEESGLNQHIFRVEPDKRLCTRDFVLYAVRHALDDLYDKAHGTGMVHVTKPVFEGHQIPLPPVAEQHRIVAKLEELLGKVDACKERLAKVPELLKRFRQSVLAAACSGRLTEDWRTGNRHGATAVEIVEAIRERRERKARTSTERQRLVDAYRDTEEGDPADLPTGWGFVALRKLTVSFDYGTSAKSQRSGKVPVLRMGNIQRGAIDWSDLVYTSDAREIETYVLRRNTVLFNRTNSPELVGKSGIYRGERPAIFAGYLIRINQVPELEPEYLNYCLHSAAAREFCAAVKTDGVSQSNINAQKLGTFEVPFCDLDEQREIVRRVEALLAIGDRVERDLREGRAQVDSVAPALLATAFRGDLVPTETELARREGRSFEPASVLLERIRRERTPPGSSKAVAATTRTRAKARRAGG